MALRLLVEFSGMAPLLPTGWCASKGRREGVVVVFRVVMDGVNGNPREDDGEGRRMSWGVGSPVAMQRQDEGDERSVICWWRLWRPEEKGREGGGQVARGEFKKKRGREGGARGLGRGKMKCF
ncbi:hypothetical protein HAX54_001224 [Datura stramonium]|uniref:Uncharacterized protein n=1 Tax=Datura stramonium TaxID=4076 RepID=A0ABS8WT08_DATST|nr:hypothetical protein [Datura stramonium]